VALPLLLPPLIKQNPLKHTSEMWKVYNNQYVRKPMRCGVVAGSAS
jgi:hypothetical protein